MCGTRCSLLFSLNLRYTSTVPSVCYSILAYRSLVFARELSVFACMVQSYFPAHPFCPHRLSHFLSSFAARARAGCVAHRRSHAIRHALPRRLGALRKVPPLLQACARDGAAEGNARANAQRRVKRHTSIHCLFFH